MAWKKIPGLTGKVYVPGSPSGAPKKHPCADCFSCQLCSDERCSVCRNCKGECRDREAEDIESKVQGTCC